MSPSFDLFGREIFDAISGDTLPLFHEPVRIEMPGRAGVDARIAKQYRGEGTAVMGFDEGAIPEYEL